MTKHALLRQHFRAMKATRKGGSAAGSLGTRIAVMDMMFGVKTR